jgi:hypothetical protein
VEGDLSEWGESGQLILNSSLAPWLSCHSSQWTPSSGFKQLKCLKEQSKYTQINQFEKFSSILLLVVDELLWDDDELSVNLSIPFNWIMPFWNSYSSVSVYLLDWGFSKIKSSFRVFGKVRKFMCVKMLNMWTWMEFGFWIREHR